MGTVRNVSSERQRSKAQREPGKLKAGQCLAGPFTCTLSPEVREQE